ncbi:FGGY-family carbohydrate kinase [Yoonia sediminilitoris]|uniref:Sugar (Pentulose or hexulose) kinase n=1 Tax=Yoonia sediminilitoris TaxID=1286148 RepID=A0A2T6K6R5_9RHOB|nr:FGGY-family carbohydrate kinase [Yoonia sediminilitoris]PUB10386.1 sugar (pentulose or hexulose) kinase [Yoonia sediminilitoris]RCW89852.1 sugar (pentulose or hexulose) kinase [Yoonia sediminilitoris]
MRSNIAVIDIGKTNVKLALVSADQLEEIAVITRPNTVLPSPPWPHFDIDGHWQFLKAGLREFHAQYGIKAITTTTHGACCALLDADGALAAPVLDYEHTGPDALASDYDQLRPAFEQTGSPRLPMGLNLGAQLHWMFATDPSLKARTAQIVTYPQFWGHMLTGKGAVDVTSLGCHTDLWNPHMRAFSDLPKTLGIETLFAPVRKPSDMLGHLLHEVAQETGLPETTPVYCGIHDSNASLYAKLVNTIAPFSVVSTGTWVITMAVGSTIPTLDPAKDTLINVNAFGDPVPSARFMGGREHDILISGQFSEPTEADVKSVLADGVMLMPAVVPDSGPFQGQTHRWVGDEPELGSGRRTAAVALYLALMIDQQLAMIGHNGAIHIEGPFARNATLLQALAIFCKCPIIYSRNTTGTSVGAALLVQDREEPVHHLIEISASWQEIAEVYAAKWLRNVHNTFAD